MKDLYKILGLKKDASAEEVKKSYFEMAKKYHPDSADESEVKKFYEVSEAYQILSDKEERKAYDLTLEGGKIEKILVEETPVHPTIYKQEVEGDDSRKKEMYQFRRSLFWKGIFKSIGFALVTMGVGYFLALVFSGTWYLGMMSGFFIGLIWGTWKNFDIASFASSKKQRKIYKIVGIALLAEGIGYFLFLILSKII